MSIFLKQVSYKYQTWYYELSFLLIDCIPFYTLVFSYAISIITNVCFIVLCNEK